MRSARRGSDTRRRKTPRTGSSRAGSTRPGLRSRSTRAAIRSAGAVSPGSGPARISTRFRTAAASTGRSASSPRSRSPSGRTSLSQSWPSATRSAVAPAVALRRRGRFAGGVPRAACRAGAGARARREPLGIVTAIAGAGAWRGRLHRSRRSRRHNADGRPRRRARQGGRVRAPRRETPWPGTVATVGRLEVEPGVANVVPARATLSVEARAGDATELDRLCVAIGFEPSYR